VEESNHFISSVLDHQTRAEAALIKGDAEPRVALWSQQDPLTLFSAGGEARSGTAAITKFFRDLAARYSNGRDFRFDIEAVEVGGDLAYSVGFELFKASIAGQPRDVVIRVTQIYRREDGVWKIVHRHGDSASGDQGFIR
jgi:ketosteroid isomerase-like protein